MTDEKSSDKQKQDEEFEKEVEQEKARVLRNFEMRYFGGNK